jgi:hypothetical protein
VERTVVIEFLGVDAAIAAHDSDAYRKAIAALDDSFEREIRIARHWIGWDLPQLRSVNRATRPGGRLGRRAVHSRLK